MQHSFGLHHGGSLVQHIAFVQGEEELGVAEVVEYSQLVMQEVVGQFPWHQVGIGVVAAHQFPCLQDGELHVAAAAHVHGISAVQESGARMLRNVDGNFVKGVRCDHQNFLCHPEPRVQGVRARGGGADLQINDRIQKSEGRGFEIYPR